MPRSFLWALFGSGIAGVYGRSSFVLETAPSLPSGWTLKSAAGDDDPMRISIALSQPKLDGLRERLLQRTTVGQHLSRSEIQQYREPDAAGAAAVQDWLVQNGVVDSRTANPWVAFNTTAKAVRSLFEAEVAYYSYDNGEPLLRTQSYSIPTSLRQHIDFVHPLAHFMPPIRAHRGGADPSRIPQRRSAAASSDAVGCNSLGITPPCIRQIYNWTYTSSPGSTTTPSPSRFGIAGFLEEVINYEDVAEFTRMYAPELASLAPPYNFTVELVANGTNPQYPRGAAGHEASLDVQYAVALAHPAQVVYYVTGGRGAKLDGTGKPLPADESDNEPYLEFLQHLVGLPDAAVPQVLSISYADDEQTVPRAYAMRVCDLFLQLAARGVSVLAASGDGGSSGTGQSRCVSNDGTGEPALLPTFPASCPWVTAVGATGNDPLTEAAYYSSGGFSNYFGLPAWQSGSAWAYHALLNGARDGMYNRSGRGIPDIAAVGSAFRVVRGGANSSLVGTSASTPVVAAMVAVANDARLRAGHGPIGWLNPVLYSEDFRTGILEDIVAGQSKSCFVNNTLTIPGWSTCPGWDPVTGVGVPSDARRFIDALVKADAVAAVKDAEGSSS